MSTVTTTRRPARRREPCQATSLLDGPAGGEPGRHVATSGVGLDLDGDVDDDVRVAHRQRVRAGGELDVVLAHHGRQRALQDVGVPAGRVQDAHALFTDDPQLAAGQAGDAVSPPARMTP